MLLPIGRPDLAAPSGPSNRASGEVELTTTALRRNYRDAVRLAAREEILADLAQDTITAQLHADTARFHHGSAHAYAKALGLLLGETLTVADDKQKAKAETHEADLGPMRCQNRRYGPFNPDRS
jgi:hypothetical protein